MLNAKSQLARSPPFFLNPLLDFSHFAADMPRLIINADDFGLTAGVNRAISEAHRAGIVTSSTLMANSPAFDQAVVSAKACQKLGVGCHVMLVDAAPLSPADTVRSLLANPKSPHFVSGISAFAHRALRGMLQPDEIFSEALAQMRKIQAAGIRLTHFDSHKHTHIFPQVLRPLLRAAKEAGVPAVRNPFAPLRAVVSAHLLRRPKLWARTSQVGALQAFAARFREEVAAAGLRTTDGTFGVLATGALDDKLFNAIIASIPEGTWEFVCHPGYNDADLSAVATRLRASRESELRILTSPSARDRLKQLEMELINFSQL
jgi:predicted glycoside hydrolase/deacetylase ChbG (UPF0249 family)